MATPKFSRERASMILAEAEIFGDNQILSKWGITRQTLHNYRVRMQSDDELLHLFTLKKRMLLIDWQQDATKCIKVGLSELQKRMPVAASEEDAKLIHAIAGAVKIVGELKIASDALADSEDIKEEAAV